LKERRVEGEKREREEKRRRRGGKYISTFSRSGGGTPAGTRHTTSHRGRLAGMTLGVGRHRKPTFTSEDEIEEIKRRSET